MFVLTAAFVVQLPYGRGSYAVSLAEIPLFIGVLALSPTTLILTRLGGVAVGLPLRGLRGATLAYRLAGTALEAAVVVGVHRAVLDDAAPLGPPGLDRKSTRLNSSH